MKSDWTGNFISCFFTRWFNLSHSLHLTLFILITKSFTEWQIATFRNNPNIFFCLLVMCLFSVYKNNNTSMSIHIFIMISHFFNSTSLTSMLVFITLSLTPTLYFFIKYFSESFFKIFFNENHLNIFWRTVQDQLPPSKLALKPWNRKWRLIIIRKINILGIKQIDGSKI